MRGNGFPFRGGRALVALAGLVVALAACGSGPTSSSPPSPSSVPSPAVASSFQALVDQTVSTPGVQSSASLVLYDSVSGQSQPITGVRGGDARFAPGGRVSVDGPGLIQTVDVGGGSPRTEVDVAPRLIGTHAWSTSGALAYATEATADLHQNAQLVVTLPNGSTNHVDLAPIVGGEGYVPPILRFSPDGSLLLLVHPSLQLSQGGGPEQTTVQVRRPDGTFVFGPRWAAQPATPDAATWGRDGRLYFWDSRGVNVAEPTTGTTRTILPGVRWSRPDTSPDGRYVVLEVADGQGVPGLRLLDTSTERIVTGFQRADASHARFVSPTQIWFHEEVACSSCKGPTELRQPLVGYDLGLRAERPTGLSGFVTDVRAGSWS